MPDWPERRDDLRARRELQRRQVRRRRLGAAGALVAVAVVAIAIVAAGGGGKTARHPVKAAAGRRGSHRPSGKARNSTPQPGWQPHTGPVPILEYHVLGEPPPGASYPELFLRQSDFDAQMRWLAQHGYEAVTLEQVEAAWYHGGVLPPKPVVLSFDDGYTTQYTMALPELRKLGWPGVLNLKAEGSDLYTSQVKTMIAAGWELAAHTIHHLDLTTLGAAQLKEEVAGSRTILRQKYHVPVDDFCYPAGRFNQTVIEAVKTAGYVGATTEIAGYASRDKPYELDRFEILRSSGVAGLAADLASG